MSKRQFDANTANPPKKQKNIDINLKDDVAIKYQLMPSLQHATMSNIIITLWNPADIKYEIVNSFNESEGKHYLHIYTLFSKIEDKVLEKLSQLAVPNRIRKLLSNFVNPIGKEILEWIEHHDCYIFNTNTFLYQDPKSICRAIDYIGYLVWTARGRIDYQETAKSLLAKEEKLLDNYKYYIACEYCFEDEIAIIAPKVIDTTLTLTCFERQPMVYFWTAHITGDFTELHEEVDNYNRKYSTNYSINECLFNRLINNGQNQVPIKYIWDKLNNEEKSRQLVSAIKKTPNSDIRCFLLSQMSKEQEKEVFQSDDADKVLLSFVDDWLWGQYLPTIHHMLDIISGCVYVDVLKKIVIKMEINHEDSAKYNQYRSVFKELWQSAPKHLKEYVFEYDGGVDGGCIFLDLFNKKNIDIIRLILAYINDEQKKQIIFSSDGIEKCSDYLISNQWDLLEMLIDHTLFCREDVECLKQTLIISKGEDVAVYFIKNKEWNKVEQILQWAFKSDEKIKEFKQNLIYSRICKDILDSILANKVDLRELECFLKWCFSGDEESVVNCKAGIAEFYFRTLIYKLITEDKYELLEQILNFCFINDQKQISQFKQNFYPGFLKCDIKILIFDLVKDNQLQSFRKFVYYWCSTDEEINKFKTCILYPTEDTGSVFIALLRSYMFKLANEFVNWCCNSSQVEIDKFKNQLMIHDDMQYLSARVDLRTFYKTEVLKWFNPSIETIIKFKEKFINCWWLKDILPALDNYVQEQQCKAKDKDIGNRL